CQQHHTYPLSF
nr:immunoglobulin light chain junction region [Macaca mulatta]MOX56534.1 immunoglobulin light chain junction region [Macaca mulatta]MOX57229.1 immunoglobulin light chain junction region [Macaca mulatta]